MKLHRFIGEYDLSQKEIKIIDPETVKQIKVVLRFKIGDKIILSDGKGGEAEVIIILISKNEISGKIERKIENNVGGKTVNLYLAILKKENFELAVQKAVEVGVSKIIPVITERTVKTGLNEARLKKIILEASEQCGRSTVPTLSPILNFKDALLDGAKAREKIIFHLGEKEYQPNDSGDSSIFIGPEGGFTKNEIELAKNMGYTAASLGPLTLRGETAAIVATYRVVNNIYLFQNFS
ncbi:MAG: RsmE family RNA methyltransferase [Candidatus Paceibacterota bacterium]|jgi:16S rRNA (uracil1498-N3)-methyltransferase